MPEPINILLVDDEQRNLDALEAILDDPMYHLLRADVADAALRFLLHHDIAAIVLDIKMPIVSGFELAKMIKGTKRFRHIPIVFLTAHLLDDQDVLTGYGTGAVDYLTKPVNPDILRHKISIFADLFRKTRALAELNEHLETRVRERTAELEKSEEALRESSKQKDSFLATLAHELRNPLGPLRAGVDILMQQAGGPATVVRTLEAMDRQVDHMVRLIDDLLDVARISRGRLEVRLEAVELNAVIHRAIETVQPLLTRRKQTVVVESDGPVAAYADGTRVAQIVGNLINNASKYSPEGTSIRVELSSAPEKATILVEDEGEGIAPEQLEQVFNMFTKIVRADLEKKSDGLGIGLALSRQLAELHGGTLAASSHGAGKGAAFTLTLPLRRKTTPPPAPAMPVAKLPPTRVLSIVVVEDNEDLADLMIIWLQELGHRTHVARTGPEGLALILESRPDLVLCDLGLPGMNGVTLCEQVVREVTPLPVMVALTGWGMDSDRQRTQQAGFQHHLVKPVTMDKLRAILRAVDEERRD
jgi:signal transduction histidine kinase